MLDKLKFELELNDDQPHDFLILVYDKFGEISALGYLEATNRYHAEKAAKRLKKKTLGAKTYAYIGRTASTEDFFNHHLKLMTFVKEEGVTL